MSRDTRYYDLRPSLDGQFVSCWEVEPNGQGGREVCLHRHRTWKEARTCTNRPQNPIGSQRGGTIPNRLRDPDSDTGEGDG